MKDLTGNVFGRLSVIDKSGKTRHGNITWNCICSCGKTHIAASGKLIKGKVTSCGCYKSELSTKMFEKHGITTGGKPRLFIIWNGMKARCLNPKSISYKNYGDRGISICEEWLEFKSFYYWAVDNGYSDEFQIDRKNNDGNYEPSNCRWVTKQFNQNNQRKSRHITIQGQTKNISQWITCLNLHKSTVYSWLKKGEDFLLYKLGQVYIVNRLQKEVGETA